MKRRTRMLSVLLTAAMALSLLAPARAADAAQEDAATGTLRAAVRIDYVQELQELRDRGVQAELFRGKDSLGAVSLTQPGETALSGRYPARVSLRDRLGGEMTPDSSALPGALDLSVDGLPRGSYTLRVRGAGYAPCAVQFTIQDCGQYVEVGTGDRSFTLGDFDGSGKVDAADRDALAAALGSQKEQDLRTFDLNGDGRIDITDLAYVNHNRNASGRAQVRDGACIGVKLDGEQARQALADAGTAVAQGSVDGLLTPGGGGASFRRSAGSGGIEIPLPLDGTVRAEHIQIVTPDGGEGAIRQGLVEVQYEEDGRVRTLSLPFDQTPPAGAHAIGPTPGSSVITIPLGRRVAVKKVTITVTKTEGGQFAAVETIRFLRDIVPEELVQPNSEVKGLSASAGDGRVDLRWNSLPNVSGYRVEYWPEGRESARGQLHVSVPQAQVTGLENLKTYCFTVTPTDGGWSGRTCPAVTATPEPAKAPPAPDMVNVTARDSGLEVSWKASEGATYYELFYTDQADAPASAYRQWGGRLSGAGASLDGLTNGVTYYLYVTAGNRVGKSGPSRISAGTPEAPEHGRPADLPTQGLLDRSKVASVALADPRNVHAASYPADAPFKPEYMMDGDYSTHWTASGNWSRNEHVVCTFTQPVDLSAALWVPRLDGSYPTNLRAYSVRVWYAGEDPDGAGHLLAPDPEQGGVDNGGGGSDVWTWPNIPNRAQIPTMKFGILPFGPVKGVVKISVAVEQRDYLTVSLSELMFMEYDPARSLPDNVEALFADELRTRLADGVTQRQIDELRARLKSGERDYYLYPDALEDELALAEELLKAGASGGVVLRGVQARSSAADSAKYGQGGSELQPLGAAAKAGQRITVYASGIPAGESVTLYATQFNAEASAWQAKMGTVTNGRNVLVVPKIGSQNTERGGSLYFTYGGADPQGISLHVRRATDIPLLELSDWYGLDESARRARIGVYVDELTAYVSAQGINSGNAQSRCLNVTELSLPGVLLSLPAAAVLGAGGQDREAKIGNLYQNTLAWEELMHICKTTQGIDRTYAASDMTSRQNLRCMQMFAGAFMYAAGSHIGIGYGSCAGVVSGRPVADMAQDASANSLFGWGVAHEIGHNMDKLSRAEITNNIYALMAQTYDGRQNTLPSRLERGGKWPAVFARTAQGWPGASNDVFVQLGMYWQLHLAYAEGERPLDFYNRFFKAWKAGTYTQGMSGLSYDERVALTAAGTANADLTEFFTRWGMTLGDGVRQKLAAYPKDGRALWYLSDQSRRDRLDGAPAGAGTVSVGAALDGEKTIRVSAQVSLTAGTLQGVEIRRNGQPIAFVVPGADGALVYEDVIGSANHRTYTYQAAAYDSLGNLIGTAEAGEVRVAYDKTVDPAAYTMTRSGDTVTFRFRQSTAVSGLKLAGAARPAAGDFTVTVAAGFTGPDGTQAQRTVTARTGSFDRGNQAVDDRDSYLTYFQKPGAEEDDSRIWTYDAETVTVTGVPQAMADGDIRLVSYAGDDVALLAGGCAGRLAEDYRYGDGAEDVIAAGTLVIAGTYRGDPRSNTVKLLGRFTRTTDAGEELEAVERELDGYALLFAEIPEDQQVSDISDGLFLFVPDVQREAELQDADPSRCDGASLLPSAVKAVLSRTDRPEDADSQRVTAETLWTAVPGGAELPTISLEGNNG